MRYRVGLDVGTASLGVAAFSLDENNTPLELVWKAVRIFNEPLENSKGTLKSKKSARRAARMQRRQNDRRLGRTKAIAGLAPLLGIRVESFPYVGNALIEIRARAARERIELIELISVFIRIGKKRGYSGEFRPKKEGVKLGEVEGGSRDLMLEMLALSELKGFDNVTLGELLYQRWLDGKPTKLKIKDPGDKSAEGKNLYALRSQLADEFEKIWQTQSCHHPVLNSHFKGKSLKELFARAIFYQRPLKPVGGMVGQCRLEPTLARAPRAQLAFQHFRIEKILADLRWGAGRQAQHLSVEQKQVIRELCDKNDIVRFDFIYKSLEKAGCPKPESRGLNLDRASRDEIPGNKTNQVFRRLGLGDAWRNLSERTQIQVINFLAELGSPEQLDDPLWYERFTKRVRSKEVGENGKLTYKITPRVFDKDFIEFINLVSGSEKFGRLSKMGFESGRASYSIKALNTLRDWMEKEGCGQLYVDEEAAISACYPKSVKKSIGQKKWLDFAPSTGNAVVDGSLRQIRYELNRMIGDLGAPPEEIVVEMAREMSVGIATRNERESLNNSNRRARLEAEAEIRKHGEIVTPSKIRRYLLWVEQGKQYCPYCTRVISLEDALNGAETEYEHVVPKSLTQVGLKRSEIVLAHRSCNFEKGDRTPYQAWGHDPERWLAIQSHAKYFLDNKRYRKAKLLLLEDFEKEVLTDESVAGFADHQFHQTSWIAKDAAKWLQDICKAPVSVSRGELTSLLRYKWKLETVIPQARIEEGLPILDDAMQIISIEDFEKYRDTWEGHKLFDAQGNFDKARHTDRKLNKRIDHRHHLIDAITIGLTSRALFQSMARQYKINSELRRNGRKVRLEVAEPPIKNLREISLAAVRECPLSIKYDRQPDGVIFQDTAYGVAVRGDDGKTLLTLRKGVATLVDKKKGTVEQARAAIHNIVSPITRGIIEMEFEHRVASGKTAVEALSMPIYQNLYGQRIEIKRVNLFTNKYADDVAIISHTSKDGCTHQKRLLNAGYSYLETEILDSRIVKQELVNVREALNRSQTLRPKQQSKSGEVLRLHKNDMVLDSRDGKKYRVAYFKAEGKVFLVPIVDPRAFDDIKEKKSGKKNVSFRQVMRLKRLD